MIEIPRDVITKEVQKVKQLRYWNSASCDKFIASILVKSFCTKKPASFEKLKNLKEDTYKIKSVSAKFKNKDAIYFYFLDEDKEVYVVFCTITPDLQVIIAQTVEDYLSMLNEVTNAIATPVSTGNG